MLNGLHSSLKQLSDFQKMRNNLQGSFVLLDDLDLSTSFIPIGSKTQLFEGIFELKET